MPLEDTIVAIIGLATYLPTYVTFLLMALIARMGRAQFSHTVKTSMGD
jgi:hypothetical protein